MRFNCFDKIATNTLEQSRAVERDLQRLLSRIAGDDIVIFALAKDSDDLAVCQRIVGHTP
jgi:hypothetical protein